MQGMNQSSAAVADHVATTIFGIVDSRADSAWGVSAGVSQWPTPGWTPSAPRVAIGWLPAGADGGAPRCDLVGASRFIPSSGADMVLSAQTSASHLRKQAIGATCTATCRPTCTAACKDLASRCGVRCCSTGCMHVGFRLCITPCQRALWSDVEQIGCSQIGTGCVPGVRHQEEALCQLHWAQAGLSVGKPSAMRLRRPRLQSDSVQVRRSDVGPLAGHLASHLRGQLACDRFGLDEGPLRRRSVVPCVGHRQCSSAGAIVFLQVAFWLWLQVGIMTASASRQPSGDRVGAASSQVTALHARQRVATLLGESGATLSFKLQSHSGGPAQCKLVPKVASLLVWLLRSSKEGFRINRQFVRRSGLMTDSHIGRAAGLSDRWWRSLAGGLPSVYSVDRSRGRWLRLQAGPEGGLWIAPLGGLSVGFLGGYRNGTLPRPARGQRKCNPSGPVRCESSTKSTGTLVWLSRGAKNGFRARRQAVRRNSPMVNSRVCLPVGLTAGRRAGLLQSPVGCHRMCT